MVQGEELDPRLGVKASGDAEAREESKRGASVSKDPIMLDSGAKRPRLLRRFCALALARF